MILGYSYFSIMEFGHKIFEGVEEVTLVRHYEKALENVVNREY
jgi:hypothetical protein